MYIVKHYDDKGNVNTVENVNAVKFYTLKFVNKTERRATIFYTAIHTAGLVRVTRTIDTDNLISIIKEA